MVFELKPMIEQRRGDGFGLHSRFLNPQAPRVLHSIGFDVVYERAEGPYLYDSENLRYLDFLSGFGVFGIGRNHPVVRQALADALSLELADLVQMDTPLLSGLLAEKLLSHAPGLDRVYFANSGTEAVEAALKFARAATGRPRILYFDHAFHGLTVGSLSVNGSAEFRRGFGPLLPDTAVPTWQLDTIEAELAKGDVAGLIVEPIQGKGVNIAPAGFLAQAQQLLRNHGALLICDEVQTGIGRTGRFFAYEYEGVDPDIVTVAKTLSGGYVPVGATLAKNWIFEKVYPSMDRVMAHSCTFGGGALAMVAGLATLAVIEEEDLVERAAQLGGSLLGELEAMVPDYEFLSEVRGRGLMIGIEFGRPRSLRLRSEWAMLQAARRGLFGQSIVIPLFQRHRVLTQVAADNVDVIKLLPPMVVSEADLRWFLDAFREVMDEAEHGKGVVWDLGRVLVKQALAR